MTELTPEVSVQSGSVQFAMLASIRAARASTYNFLSDELCAADLIEICFILISYIIIKNSNRLLFARS